MDFTKLPKVADLKAAAVNRGGKDGPDYVCKATKTV